MFPCITPPENDRGGLYKEEESPLFNTPQEKKKSSTLRRSPTSIVLRKKGESEG
jgi:hypothetical protein